MKNQGGTSKIGSLWHKTAGLATLWSSGPLRLEKTEDWPDWLSEVLFDENTEILEVGAAATVAGVRHHEPLRLALSQAGEVPTETEMESNGNDRWEVGGGASR